MLVVVDLSKTSMNWIFFYDSQKKSRKQKAMNEPMMMPSLRFLADMRLIRVLMPGTLLAAMLIRLLMLAMVSP